MPDGSNGIAIEYVPSAESVFDFGGIFSNTLRATVPTQFFIDNDITDINSYALDIYGNRPVDGPALVVSSGSTAGSPTHAAGASYLSFFGEQYDAVQGEYIIASGDDFVVSRTTISRPARPVRLLRYPLTQHHAPLTSFLIAPISSSVKLDLAWVSVIKSFTIIVQDLEAFTIPPQILRASHRRS